MWLKPPNNSIGRGNKIVEFLSAEIVCRDCRYLEVNQSFHNFNIINLYSPIDTIIGSREESEVDGFFIVLHIWVILGKS